MSAVFATAGHVDHGKSTLIRALTGINPDRLEAERERGLTIELGFAWADFGGVPVSFVDVPGHEKFITTALSGVGAVPLALFVVAADDEWMPQAAEHLAALDALGVRFGVVAVTRADLADPAPAAARARTEIERTSLKGAKILPVCAPTGAGIQKLRGEISRLARLAPRAGESADVRVWIDRKFSVRGAGTVVTATLPAGTVAEGEELASPGGPVRIRGIESMNAPRPRVAGPARVALNLTGATADLGRGQPLWVAGAWWQTTLVDVRLTGEASPPPRTPIWHIGAHATQVTVRRIGPDHARLTLPAPLPLRQGDRGILRDPGDRRLWGTLVLDPDPPLVRGSRGWEGRARDLSRRGDRPEAAAEIEARGIVSGATLRELGLPGPGQGWHTSAAWRSGAARRIGELVRAHDEANPAHPGLAPAHLRRALGLPPEVPLDVVLSVLPPGLRHEGGRVTSRAAELPGSIERALEALAGGFAHDPFAAPSQERLRDLGLSAGDLAAAARAGRVFLPAPGVVLPPDAPARALEILRDLPAPFTTSSARRALGTSRRVVIPLLEFLDRAQRTRRLPGDAREVIPGPGQTKGA